jgi:hypothetical protein
MRRPGDGVQALRPLRGRGLRPSLDPATTPTRFNGIAEDRKHILLFVSGQQRQQQRDFSGADINSPADLPG